MRPTWWHFDCHNWGTNVILFVIISHLEMSRVTCLKLHTWLLWGDVISLWNVQVYYCSATGAGLLLQCYRCRSIAAVLQVQVYYCSATGADLLLQCYRCRSITAVLQVQIYYCSATGAGLLLQCYRCRSITEVLQVQVYYCSVTGAGLLLQCYRCRSHCLRCDTCRHLWPRIHV